MTGDRGVGAREGCSSIGYAGEPGFYGRRPPLVGRLGQGSRKLFNLDFDWFVVRMMERNCIPNSPNLIGIYYRFCSHLSKYYIPHILLLPLIQTKEMNSPPCALKHCFVQC